MHQGRSHGLFKFRHLVERNDIFLSTKLVNSLGKTQSGSVHSDDHRRETIIFSSVN